jgi:hypothetical protein
MEKNYHKHLMKIGKMMNLQKFLPKASKPRESSERYPKKITNPQDP